MAPTGCGQDGEQSRGKRSVRRGRKNQLPNEEPWSSRKRYGSDLTKTIRARGHQQRLHREAGHTTVPDPHAALRSKSCLPIRGASTYVRSRHGRPKGGRQGSPTEPLPYPFRRAVMARTGRGGEWLHCAEIRHLRAANSAANRTMPRADGTITRYPRPNQGFRVSSDIRRHVVPG